MQEHVKRMGNAARSLQGLNLGDCFGQTFFGVTEVIEKRLSAREIVDGPWYFTDDTVMGIGVYRILKQYGEIRQDELAKIFGINYLKDWHRGYGGTAHSILQAIGEGGDWRTVSPAVFDGMGSMGNGAAMRAGIIGAYFYDDLDKAAEQAVLSAQVTHYNEEGIAGAVAAAVAAALAYQRRAGIWAGNPVDFIRSVAQYVPESDTKYKILKGCEIEKNSHIDFIVSVLGNGSGIIAQDTLPISVWFAAHYMDNLEEALWQAVSALGDRDTIGAIVGSIVVMYDDSAPGEWVERMEQAEMSEFFE